MPLRIGLCAPTSGATETFYRTAEALQASVFTWMAMNLDGPHKPHDALRLPSGTHILRIANPARYEYPAAWMARVVPVLDAWVSAGIPPGALIVQHGNEPDQGGAVDLGNAWDLGVWSFCAHDYRDALKVRYPNLPLLAPPFTCANTKYLTAEYVAPYEGVAVHCYWSQGNPGWRQGVDGGAAWVAALFGKPIYVTEVNSNPTDPAEIVAWAKEVDSPLVMGATIFIADSPEWPYNVTPDQAAKVRAGLQPPPLPPPPPPPPAKSPLAYDGSVPRGTLMRMIDAGSVGPGTSPFLGIDKQRDLDDACRGEDVSVRVMLAWLRSENRMATDISPGLLAAHNGAGIKYVGQRLAINGRPGVVAPLAPAGEGYAPYCVFANWRDFFATLAINIRSILPDAWARGDLARIASYYTTGHPNAGGGASKVAFYREYSDRTVYPDGEPPDPAGIPLAHVMDVARAHIGRSLTDEGNPEFGMCEQFVEEVLEQAIPTVPRVRYPTAAARGDALAAAGSLRRAMPPPAGAPVVWDRTFDPEGHIAIADEYPYVVTTYRDSDPATIDVISRIDGTRWYQAAGFLGWFVPEGVGEGEMPRHRRLQVPMKGKGFAPSELRAMWYATAKPTKTAIANFPYEPDKLGTHGSYGELANGTFNNGAGQDYTDLSICLGKCLSKETPDPGTPGRSVIQFELGKIEAVKQPDGKYLLTVN